MIQRRLKVVNGNIQYNKRGMHNYEGRVNQDEERLKQLESTIKEGLFCVEWCLVMSMRTVNSERFIVKMFIHHGWCAINGDMVQGHLYEDYFISRSFCTNGTHW